MEERNEGNTTGNYHDELVESCNALRLPMTSTFTPPAACESRWTPLFTTYSSPSSYTSFKGTLTRSMWDTSCFPPIPSSNTPCLSVDVFPTFSPGVCPQGWSSFMAISTTVVCCPSGFTYYTATTPNVCETVFATAEAMTIFWDSTYAYSYTRISTAGGSSTTSTSIDSETYGISTVTVFPFGTKQVHAIWIETQTEQGQQTAVTTVTKEPSAATTSSDGIPESHGLTAGTEAGIAVGVILFAIMLGCGVLVYWRRKRNAEEALPATAGSEWIKPEVRVVPRAELDGRDEPRELNGFRNPAELG